MPCVQPSRGEVREMGFELSEISLGHGVPRQASHLAGDPRDHIPAPPYPEANSSRSSDIVTSQGTLDGWAGYRVEEGGFQWIVEPLQDGLWSLVQRFDFSWFAWSVGIGVTSILIHTCSEMYPPYQVYLLTASIVYFMINVVLFCSISALTITRYCFWPKLFRVTMNHPRQAGFIAMMPMALATIVTMSSKLVGSNQKTIMAVWAMCQMDPGSHLTEDLAARYFLPVAALIFVAAASSDVAARLDGIPALITIMIGYILLILTLFPVLLVLYSCCDRLIEGKNAPPEHIMGAFISITAMAQMVLATQQLGEQAFRILPPTIAMGNTPVEDDASIGFVCDSTGMVLAMFLWVLCFFWFVVVYALFTMVVPSDKLVSTFTLSRWSAQISYGFFGLAALRIGMRRTSASMLFTQVGVFLGLIAVWNCHLYSCVMIHLARKDGLKGLLSAPELAGPWNLQPADTHSTTTPHRRWSTRVLSIAAGCYRVIIRGRTSRD